MCEVQISLSSSVDNDNSWLCPITGEIMLDPVLIVETGHSYERTAITRWLNQAATEPRVRDPITNTVLQEPPKLVTNHTLRQCINESMSYRRQISTASSEQSPCESTKNEEKQPADSQNSGADASHKLRRRGHDHHHFSASLIAGGAASIVTIALLLLFAHVRQQCLCGRHLGWLPAIAIVAASASA